MSVPEIGALTDRVSVVSAGRVLNSRWARVRRLRGTDGQYTVITRFDPTITPGDAFLYRGRQIVVESAEDLNGRRAWSRFIASEALPNPPFPQQKVA